MQLVRQRVRDAVVGVVAGCSPPEGIFTVQRGEGRRRGRGTAARDELQSPGGDFHGATGQQDLDLGRGEALVLQSPGGDFHGATPLNSPRRSSAPSSSRCSPPEGIFTVQLELSTTWFGGRLLWVAVPRRGFSRCNQMNVQQLDVWSGWALSCSPPEGIFTVQLGEPERVYTYCDEEVAVPRRGFSRCNR